MANKILKVGDKYYEIHEEYNSMVEIFRHKNFKIVYVEKSYMQEFKVGIVLSENRLRGLFPKELFFWSGRLEDLNNKLSSKRIIFNEVQ